jgi:pyridoxal phosphate enzyme (YggS family)
MTIAQNIAAIREKINAAAIAAGRDPKDISLCAATKMNNADAVQQAIAGGIDCCGENRVQELTQKLSENAYVGAPVHFIGHLQTNKVKQVVGKVDLIQSVDSEHLAAAINTYAGKIGIIQDILLEVNIANEESKSGFSLQALYAFLEKAADFSSISIRGLMAIPPITQNSTDNHKFFQEMYNLSVDIMAKKYDNVRVDILSMGMSDDYTDAIACGSTMVRIGTAIFGARDYVSSHP